MTRSLGVLAGFLALVTTTPAGAATVDLRYDAEEREWRVVYEAAPGERNDLRVRNTDTKTVRVHDPAVPVTARGRCRRVDGHTARCRMPRETPEGTPYLATAIVRLHDGDDRALVEGNGLPRLLGDAGPGDDVVVGSEQGADELDGGGGRDHLTGRGNSNRLTDGDGRDGAPVDADVLEDGLVDYSARTGDLVVDLVDPRVDGERGVGDRLVRIDYVVGGAGDDDITGGPEFSQLWGGPGDDRVDGGPGDDSLYGGPGNDRVLGREGDDLLFGEDGRDQLRGDAGNDNLIDVAGDLVACGEGVDGLDEGRGVFAGPDCEMLHFGFAFGSGYPTPQNDTYDDQGVTVEPSPVLSSSGRSVRVVIGCPQRADGDGTCGTSSGLVRVATTRGWTLGTGRVRHTGDGGPRRPAVLVPLNETGRRLAAAGAILRLSVRGRSLPTASWRARARPAP